MHQILATLRNYLIQKEINYDAVKYLLSYSYIPTPLSIFKGIFKLPPSKIVTIDLNKYNFREFKSYKDFIADVAVFESEYFSLVKLHESSIEINDFASNVDVLGDALNSAVKKQLISDVPLGAFLSGGVDSSLVVAFAREHVDKLKTFNIGFEFSNFDESVYANEVAKILGTDHESYICTKKEAINIIKNLPYAYTEPFADASQIPTMLVSKVASNNVKVVLTGDSGDELFGGYNRYSFTNHYWKFIKNFTTLTSIFCFNFTSEITIDSC